MQILFTRSGSILSKLIRSETGEPVSHCAIHWRDWVIHSNLLGVHIELLSTFIKSSEIMYAVEVPEDSERVLKCLAEYEGNWYDFGALLYMGLRYLIPMLPKKNLWSTTGMFLCTEWITEVLYNKEDSGITPYQLYLSLTNNKENTK